MVGGMRFFLIFFCLLASTQEAFAQMLDYSDPTSHQQRVVPKRQYNNGSARAENNGRMVKGKSSKYTGNSDYDLDIGIEGGYRTSQLKWNIGGDGVSVPNILSELEWENVNGYEVKPSIEYTRKTGSFKGINVQASVNKSITTSGKNQDSDYAGNNRTAEFSRSNNTSEAGHSEGFSASIGYAFNFSGNRKQNVARFTALVGYAMQNQKFVMHDGFQTIPATGAFPNLVSSYDMELSMPFVGADFYSQFADVHSIKLNTKIYRGTFNGTGHWNLRTDFAQPDSFTQEADGYGLIFGAKYGWNFYPDLKLTLATNLNYFKAKSGTDIVYFADGSTGESNFREVRFLSTDYLAGLNYSF